MSTKKQRITRQFGKSDFKKIAPDQLAKLGYSRKAERYKPPKGFDKSVLDKKSLAEYNKTGTISKRKQSQLVFGLTLEQKAKKIATGQRPILENAPKKARTAKIIKSSEKRSVKGKTKHGEKEHYINVKDFPERGLIRYDYFLGHDIDSITLDKLYAIMSNHPLKSTCRIVVEKKDTIEYTKNKKTGKDETKIDVARSSDLTTLEQIPDFITEFSDDLLEEYTFLQYDKTNPNDILNINYWLWVYVKN